MNNRECVISVLAAHREARMWTDEAVADDLLGQLGLDPEGAAEKAKAPPSEEITEDEVAALEAAAQEATAKAEQKRAEFAAQHEAMTAEVGEKTG